MNRNSRLIFLIFSLLWSGENFSQDTAQDVVRSDGATRLAITATGSQQNPAWSPQGDAILFTQWQGGYNEGPADLRIFSSADNSTRTLVSDGSDNVNLPGSSWNPTTRKIVFSSSRVPHDEVYEIAADGQPGEEVRITNQGQMMSFEPSLSPDGQWVVFESHPLDVEVNGVITKFRVDGTSSYILLTNPLGDARQPNWSPAEDQVLYQQLDSGQWDVWVVSADGQSRHKVTSGPGDKTDASFSPDGQWIVYSGESDNANFADLFAIPIAGGEPIRISDYPEGTDGAASWSPDGRRIVFESVAGEPGGPNGTTLWEIPAPQGIVQAMAAFQPGDADGDGIADAQDAFPNDATESADSDNDGVGDNADIFPTDASEWVDTDMDGIGDNSDPDNTTLARVYLMTNSASVNFTSLHIINSSSSAQAFAGTLYNGDGDQLGNADTPLYATNVSPQGRLILSASELEDLFTTGSWNGPAMLEVKGTSSFDLMAKLTSPSGLVSNTNCVAADRAHNVEGFDSSNMTYIRFINSGVTSIHGIKGSLFDTVGNVIGRPDVTFLSQLNPKQAVWLNRNELGNLIGQQWSGVATLVISDPAAALKLLNLNFVNSETFFNFSCFESSDSKSVYLMTNSNSLNISATHIINTSSQDSTFTGTLYSGSGMRIGDAGAALHSGVVRPNGRVILTAQDLEQLMNAGPWSGPAMLEIEGAGSFGLMTKLKSPSGLTSNTNCVRRKTVHNIVGFDSSNMTFVRFINQGTSAINNITGTLYDVNGSVLGTANTLLIESLGPKQAVWLQRNNISALFSVDWNGEVSLTAGGDLDDDLRLLNLNFVNGETFFNFSCYEGGASTASTDGNWYVPPPLTTWQWQLRDVVNTSYNVALYDIDLFDSPVTLIQQLQASGKKVICYFSAGSFEGWRTDSSQFADSDSGNTLDGFPDERWLDIRSANVRSIMEARMDLASEKGCDGVEPDNMDGYVNDSGFSLTAEDQLEFNRFIAMASHSRNLTVGLKNDLDQIDQLVDVYDFAVNEQCFEFSECGLLAPFINSGKAVFSAEYLQVYVDDESARVALCNESVGRQFSTLILPLQLDDQFRFSCL